MRNLKLTKIYSQGILANYAKICTNENFPLYGGRFAPPAGQHKSGDAEQLKLGGGDLTKQEVPVN